jgi:hypothetical protein
MNYLFGTLKLNNIKPTEDYKKRVEESQKEKNLANKYNLFISEKYRLESKLRVLDERLKFFDECYKDQKSEKIVESEYFTRKQRQQTINDLKEHVKDSDTVFQNELERVKDSKEHVEKLEFEKESIDVLKKRLETIV